MAVNVYYSTDGSAPVLTGEAGTLVNLLKKCLVDGYGSKAGAGWTGLYNATFTKGAFQGAAGSTGCWLHVEDAGSNATYTYRTAHVRGYESLASLDGSGNPVSPGPAFPTVAQQALLPTIIKSNALDATSRPWILVADDRAFYLITEWNSTYLGHGGVSFFGDIFPYRTGDAWHCALIGQTSENPASLPSANSECQNLVAFSATQAQHYIARRYDQTGGAVAFGKTGNNAVSTTMGFTAGYTYPSPVDNALLLNPVMVNESSLPRGLLPGLYQPLHVRPLAAGATIDNLPGLPGRTLLSLSIGCAAANGDANTGRVMLDLTGPWR